MIRHLRRFTILTMFLTAILVWLLLFWHFEKPVITIVDQYNLQTDKEVYKPWDNVIYTIDLCKRKPATATVTRSLVDWIKINYDTKTSSVSEWCIVVHNADLFIPDFVSDSTYHIEIALEYKVNPIKTEIVYMRTRDFMVKN